MKADEQKEHDRLKAQEQKEHAEKEHEDDELHKLDAAERSGQVLTGAQRGRLADLRKADILKAVEALLHPHKEGKKS